MPLPTVEITDATLGHSPFTLADRCGVRSPDSRESPGARLLGRIQDYANEADTEALLDSIRAFVKAGNDAEEYSVNDLDDGTRDRLSEWADSCVQIYTYQLWQEFTDLCLYEEDLSDLGPVDADDLTRNVAMRAEYLVAERGLGVLLAERAIALLEANQPVHLATPGDAFLCGEDEGDGTTFHHLVTCEDCHDEVEAEADEHEG